MFLINSLKLSVAGSVGAMVVAAPAAYAFSRLSFRGNSALLIGVLALQMISPLVVVIPLYRYFAPPEPARLALQHVDGLHRHPGAACDLDA